MSLRKKVLGKQWLQRVRMKILKVFSGIARMASDIIRE